MKAVFKRELSLLCHRIYVYAYVAISWLATALSLSSNNLTYASENVGALVSSMSLIALVTAPIAAACVLPCGRREGIDDLYLQLPVKPSGIPAGKYLAALTTVLVSDAVLLVSPLIAGFFGQVDHLASYTALLGYVLMQTAWLSVCLFVFKAIKHRAISWVVAYGTVAVTVGLSVAILYMPTSLEPLARVIRALLPTERLTAFTMGILDLGGVLYFAAVTVLFTCLFFTKYTAGRKKFGAKRIIVLAVAAILCIFSVASVFLPKRAVSFDATLAGKATPSDEALEFFGKLDKKVAIYLLEPAPEDSDYGIKTRIYNLYLDKLVSASPNVTLKNVYYDKTPEFYDSHGISPESVVPNSLVVECGDRTRYVSFYSLLYYSNKNMGIDKMSLSEYTYAIQVYSSNEQYANYLYSLAYDTSVYSYVDAVICGAVEYVTADVIPQNYYLTGHGEPSADKATSVLSEWKLPSLDIGERGVPADAASILVNTPTEDISEAEKNSLMEYLSGGGQLTFITDEKTLDMPNIMSILDAYGMSVQNREFVKQPLSEGEERELTELSLEADCNNDILGELGEIEPTVSCAHAITMRDGAKEGLLTYPLLTTSDKCYVGEDTTATAGYTVACAAETPDGARLVWFTGGSSVSKAENPTVRVLGYALVWVTLEYTSHTSDLAPTLYSPPMTQISSFASDVIILTVCLSAIAVIAYGAIKIYRRKRV